jgi:uncharacterized protein YhfF
MDVETFWQHFKAAHPEITTTHHDTYAFGATDESADLLAHLVKIGQKTATTSALDLYEADEPLPFDQVTQEHAYHEGEDDRTLTTWRREHRAFFTAAYHEMGRTFNEQIPCFCEVFECVD